ncbi:hypothetical protein AB0J14_16010 [Micromonospora arborensis]|uniref:hypothetical protein n=1 Tax=Micromonospora arborensis TaxID=2116518 RepID=UPI0033C10ADC
MITPRIPSSSVPVPGTSTAVFPAVSGAHRSGGIGGGSDATLKLLEIFRRLPQHARCRPGLQARHLELVVEVVKPTQRLRGG